MEDGAASNTAGCTVPMTGHGAAPSIETRPFVSTVPVRNPIDERWPSPMLRTLMMNRAVPAGDED